MKTIKQIKKETGLHVTTNHTGKMTDIYSLSTSCKCNEFCKQRQNIDGSICSKCFAEATADRYKALEKNLAINTEILTTRILSDEEIPYINAPLGMFRFEAFGDLNNEIQVVNYFRIAELNSHCKCALWTKNPWIIADAIEHFGIKKPENLIIIGSSYMINKDMKSFYDKYDFIDYRFTVYSKEYIRENNIVITCGARSCATCQKCYKGTHTEKEIREQLK